MITAKTNRHEKGNHQKTYISNVKDLQQGHRNQGAIKGLA